MTAGRQEGVLHLMNEVYNCPPIRAAFYALSDEDRAQQKEGETRRRRTTHSSSDMEKGIGTSGTRTERDQETRTNKPFRNTRARAQIVHVKPPPDTPSSFEATDVYIPGPETSVPDPDRTVGRGQKVSLRRVPDYDKRLLETCGHAK
ncbi:hypothetical protein Bbelb_030790 [Branchiostoma belcheri]|nr:hypothetical protein Bbelb_030790 [Branchiostoma belcheri]